MDEIVFDSDDLFQVGDSICRFGMVSVPVPVPLGLRSDSPDSEDGQNDPMELPEHPPRSARRTASGLRVYNLRKRRGVKEVKPVTTRRGGSLLTFHGRRKRFRPREESPVRFSVMDEECDDEVEEEEEEEEEDEEEECGWAWHLFEEFSAIDSTRTEPETPTCADEYKWAGCRAVVSCLRGEPYPEVMHCMSREPWSLCIAAAHFPSYFTHYLRTVLLPLRRANPHTYRREASFTFAIALVSGSMRAVQQVLPLTTDNGHTQLDRILSGGGIAMEHHFDLSLFSGAGNRSFSTVYRIYGDMVRIPDLAGLLRILPLSHIRLSWSNVELSMYLEILRWYEACIDADPSFLSEFVCSPAMDTMIHASIQWWDAEMKEAIRSIVLRLPARVVGSHMHRSRVASSATAQDFAYRPLVFTMEDCEAMHMLLGGRHIGRIASAIQGYVESHWAQITAIKQPGAFRGLLSKVCATTGKPFPFVYW